MKRPSILALLVLVALTAPSSARAAGNANAKIMLHALATTARNPCVRAENLPTTCAGFNAGINNLAFYPTVYYAYLLVVDGSLTEGVGGLQLGIAYDGPGARDTTGVDIYGWTLCATLEFQSPTPVWPNSGSGNLIIWNASGPQCTSPPGNGFIGAVGVAGYFYLTAYIGPSSLRVTRRPVDGQAKVTNCASVEDIIQGCGPVFPDYFLGALGFGRPGHNPCGVTCPDPVEPSSWSKVKTLLTTP